MITVEQDFDRRLHAGLTKTAIATDEKYVQYTPGVYQMSRSITSNAGFSVPSSMGQHRFLMVVPENPDDFKEHLTTLPGGQKVVIMGAYNRPAEDYDYDTEHSRLLLGRINDDTDVRAAAEATDRFNKKQLYNVEMQRVKMSKRRSTDAVLRKMLRSMKNYQDQTEGEGDLQAYPGNWENLQSRGRNSNTFIKSMMREAGLRRHPKFEDRTPGYNLTLPKNLFKSADLQDRVLESLAPLSVVIDEGERYVNPFKSHDDDDLAAATRYLNQRFDQRFDAIRKREGLTPVIKNMALGALIGGGLGGLKGYVGEGHVGSGTKSLAAIGAGLGAGAPLAIHLLRRALAKRTAKQRAKTVRETPEWIRKAMVDPDVVGSADVANDTRMSPLVGAEVGSFGLGLLALGGATLAGGSPMTKTIAGLGGFGAGAIGGWIFGAARKQRAAKKLKRALKRYRAEHGITD